MYIFLRFIVRTFLVGVICACALPAMAVDSDTENDGAAVDPDTIPRVVGGGSTVGGAQNILVIPYALPQIPADAAAQVGKKTPWRAPDLSGIYKHRARLYQNPWPSTGITPGTTVGPMALTLHPELVTDRLGSRGDYHTPLLRPWAAELVKRFGDAEAASQPYFERCLQDDGLLLTWSQDPGGNRGMQILQTPERLYLFFGHDVVRIVHLGTEHPAEYEPSVNGHSVGYWEGETLVVDTIGFDGTSEGDRFGTPSSEQMHVVERMNLRHGSQILEVHFWVDDPLVYTQPWTSVVTYPRAERLGREYVCREGLMFPSPY
jgi:hypothetical protein